MWLQAMRRLLADYLFALSSYELLVLVVLPLKLDSMGVPNQGSYGNPNTGAVGSYFGAGLGGVISNGLPCQLMGPFSTLNYDLAIPGSPSVSGSIAFGANGFGR